MQLYYDDEGENSLVITPGLVSVLIRKSIELGWVPTEKGLPLECTLVDQDLEIRRGL